MSAYKAQFACHAGQVTGEWTPRYMYDPWAIEALATVSPNSRILVLLRDPVERAISGVRYELQRTSRPIDVLLDEAIRRSQYRPQLDRLWRVFAPEQVLVQQFEHCVAEPDAELARCLSFLGLASAPNSAAPTDKRNASRVSDEPGTRWIRTIRERLSGEADRTLEVLPAFRPELWQSAQR